MKAWGLARNQWEDFGFPMRAIEHELGFRAGSDHNVIHVYGKATDNPISMASVILEWAGMEGLIVKNLKDVSAEFQKAGPVVAFEVE